MKGDGNIEYMFTRFQVLMYGLQVLNKSYTNANHVKKILRSLPAKYRPKIIVIQEAKDLNTISLKSLFSNLQSHEMELNGDGSEKQVKTLALNYFERSERSSKLKGSKKSLVMKLLMKNLMMMNYLLSSEDFIN